MPKAPVVALDDPLRIHDMKVPASVYGRRGGARPPQKLTLGRVSNTNRVQLRRKNAVTNRADESCRLRSLSAEERRIMDRIGGSSRAAGSGGASAVNGGNTYQELCRNIRLTFTGNMAISCVNLAANQARAKRASDASKRPPGTGAAGPGAVSVHTPGAGMCGSLGRHRSSRRRVPGGKETATGGGGIGGGRHRSVSASTGNGAKKSEAAKRRSVSRGGDVKKAGECWQPIHQTSDSSELSAVQPYSREANIIKEVNNSDTPLDRKSTHTAGSSCSPAPNNAAVKSLEQRLSSLDLRGANPQTVDTMASLSSWVHAGSHLLRHISAAREGTTGDPRLVNNQQQQQLQQLQQQQQMQQQQQQQLLEDWDPSEVNVSRLIRRRHLEALLSNGCGNGHGLVDQLLE